MKKLFLMQMTLVLFAIIFTSCIPVTNDSDQNQSGSQPIPPEVGYIFMSDGTCWPLDTYSTHLNAATPVGIVCKVCNEGEQFKGYILGLKKAGWCTWASSTKERDIKRTNIIGNQWGGDTYGGDNFVSGSGVFNAAQNYGSNEELASTSYNSGWYVPTAYELYNYIAVNRTVLNNALSEVGEYTLDSEFYWTSSQCESSSYAAWRINPSNKNCEEYDKTGWNNVCVLHTF